MSLNHQQNKTANPVCYAVIGCGLIADKHAAALRETPDAKLVACYSFYKEDAQRYAHAHGLDVFDSYEDLLASPNIDAVSLCTPSGLHTPEAIQALAAGKHVLMEKPMSLTLEDADRLIYAMEQSPGKAGIISQFRFSPAVQEIKRAIDAGAFGKIVSGSLQMKYFRSDAYYASGAWRGTWAMDGGGALMNQGIHGIDIFRYLMGPAKCLTAYARTLSHDIEVEDHAVAILEFQNGALGTIEGSTACYPGYPRRFEICGSKGSVVLAEDAILSWDLPIPCLLPVGKAAAHVASSDPMSISNEGHLRQYINFTRAILYDEPLLADAYAGRQPLEIILAIYASQKDGKTVDMKEYTR